MAATIAPAPKRHQRNLVSTLAATARKAALAPRHYRNPACSPGTPHRARDVPRQARPAVTGLAPQTARPARTWSTMSAPSSLWIAVGEGLRSHRVHVPPPSDTCGLSQVLCGCRVRDQLRDRRDAWSDRAADPLRQGPDSTTVSSRHVTGQPAALSILRWTRAARRGSRYRCGAPAGPREHRESRCRADAGERERGCSRDRTLAETVTRQCRGNTSTDSKRYTRTARIEGRAEGARVTRETSEDDRGETT